MQTQNKGGFLQKQIISKTIKQAIKKSQRKKILKIKYHHQAEESSTISQLTTYLHKHKESRER